MEKTLVVPALVSDTGTSKWGQVAVTLHARFRIKALKSA
jgi:hypothetical protein